jgi:hypothetical protein
MIADTPIQATMNNLLSRLRGVPPSMKNNEVTTKEIYLKKINIRLSSDLLDSMPDILNI